MADKITLAPARAGLRIPNPDARGADLPAAGARVTNNTYWRRLIKAGDVVGVSGDAAIQTDIASTADSAITTDSEV